MQIWRQKFDIPSLNAMSQNTLMSIMGIEYTGFGDNWLEATLPVDSRTFQPQKLLHGGASVVLAETLGSVASALCLDADHVPVGIEVNANHLKGVRAGKVIGRVEPLRLGKTLHVWEIKIRDESSDLVCVSRLTVAVRPR